MYTIIKTGQYLCRVNKGPSIKRYNYLPKVPQDENQCPLLAVSEQIVVSIIRCKD